MLTLTMAMVHGPATQRKLRTRHTACLHRSLVKYGVRKLHSCRTSPDLADTAVQSLKLDF